MTFRIVNPDPLGRPSGWNHGLLAPAGGRVLFVAGQIAPERAGLVEQWAGALERVLEVVRAAGGGPEDIGRLTVYVTDRHAALTDIRRLPHAACASVLPLPARPAPRRRYDHAQPSGSAQCPDVRRVPRAARCLPHARR